MQTCHSAEAGSKTMSYLRYIPLREQLVTRARLLLPQTTLS